MKSCLRFDLQQKLQTIGVDINFHCNICREPSLFLSIVQKENQIHSKNDVLREKNSAQKLY